MWLWATWRPPFAWLRMSRICIGRLALIALVSAQSPHAPVIAPDTEALKAADAATATHKAPTLTANGAEPIKTAEPHVAANGHSLPPPVPHSASPHSLPPSASPSASPSHAHSLPPSVSPHISPHHALPSHALPSHALPSMSPHSAMPSASPYISPSSASPHHALPSHALPSHALPSHALPHSASPSASPYVSPPYVSPPYVSPEHAAVPRNDNPHPLGIGARRFPHPNEPTPDQVAEAIVEAEEEENHAMLKDPKEMARREEEWKKMQEAAAANAAHATNQAAPETAKILKEEHDDDHQPSSPVPGEEGAPADDNSLCLQWAQDGECIRNPQYMWMSCFTSCSSLLYIDAEDDCSGWAQNGECEKNPGFMFEKCNRSCVDVARHSTTQPDHEAHRNPHLAADLFTDHAGGEPDTRSHRASHFIPVFVCVLAIFVCFAGVLTALARY